MLFLWPFPVGWSATHPCLGAQSSRAGTARLVASSSTATALDFEQKKAALIEGLRREYESFFTPMETELYAPGVSFEDPLISLTGVDEYKKNVEMLAGTNAFGKLCFTDCGLVMHSVEEPSARELTTRWTLQFRFKLLPWKPLARFSGVSKYTLDEQARVTRQQDFWDSVNLQSGGGYLPKPKLAAFSDLLAQLAPQRAGAQAASERELPFLLLRRTPEYQVRSYPQHVSVKTEYERRLDAFGTLGAYTNGANDAGRELVAYVPSLMSVPQIAPDHVWDEYDDGPTPTAAPKAMRWPLAVPTLGEATPPKPSERVGGYAGLELMPSRVVAVLPFSDPTTERIVRGYASVLRAALVRDGLVAAEASDEEEFRLAQFDALNSFGARRSEIWIDLSGHPW